MKYCKLLLACILIHLTSNLYSNHLTGGDLSYRCVGPNQFEFTLVLYNECESIVQLSSINFFEMQYYSSSLGMTPQENSFTLFKTGNPGGEEIKFFCPGIITKCNFGGTARGMKKYTYKGTVTLPEQAPDWKFIFQQTARSTQITTAETSLETDYIIEATLNTVLAPCNNSPQFDPLQDPVTTGYTGKETNLFVGGTNSDGDEIVYSFSKPKTALDEFLDYKSGYSEVNFVSSDSDPIIDENTGQISLTPNTINEIGITDVLIQEFRDGELIASITRGVQVITSETNNNEPDLSGWLDTNLALIDEKEISFCVGDEYDIGDFTISSSDPDGDNLSFSVSPAVYQSNFVFDQANKRVLLNWRTEESDTGSFTFTITSEDDNCPEPLKVEKEYTVIIHPAPTFDIGEDYVINCNDPKEIIPNITSTGSYTYLWQNWKEEIILDLDLLPVDTILVPIGFYSDSPTYTAPEAQKIALTLTNEYGCKSSNFITANDNLAAEMAISNYCFDSISPVTTTFSDRSISPDSPIVEWEWSVSPEGFTSDEETFQEVFQTQGVKSVSLKVTNEVGCSQQILNTINVCLPPEINFQFENETCTNLPKVLFRDISDYTTGCSVEEHAVSSRTWIFDDGTLPINRSSGDTITHEYDSPGLYDVILRTITTGGCVATDTLPTEIFSRPEIDLRESDEFGLICNNPDTTLLPIDIVGGLHPYNFLWVNGTSRLSDVVGSDSTFIASSTGYYTLFVTDENNCSDSTTTQIINPINADFSYKPVCGPNDTLELYDSSSSLTPIISHLWEIDSIYSSNISNPKLFLDSLYIYNMTLTVVDSNGCSDTTENKINFIYPQNTFSIQPDTVQICVTDNVLGTAFLPIDTLDFINQISWYVGEGDTLIFKDSLLEDGYKLDFNFSDSKDFSVYHQIIFNKDPDVHPFSCTMDTLKVIKVEPEFKIEVFYDRLCDGDTSRFNIERIKGDLTIDFSKIEWIITNTDLSVADTFSTKQVDYVFPEGNRYQIQVFAEDSLGCRTSQIENQNVVSTLPIPELNYLGDRVCMNEIGSFGTSIDQTDQKIENITDYYAIINGDTAISGKGNPRNLDFDYQFQRTQFNTITYYLEDSKVSTSPFDTLSKPCRSFKTIELQLIDLPNLKVSADTVCAKEIVTVTNESTNTPFSGNIIGYQVLEEHNFVEYPSTQTTWSTTYPFGGINDFTLVAKTDSGCTDTLNAEIYVKPKPKALFETLEEFPEAFIPVNIIDTSDPAEGIEDDTTVLVASFYDLGDGTQSFDFNTTITYDTVKRYPIIHAVENNHGCVDTLYSFIDLNSYLDAPNTFSPNGDGINDGLSLIHKSILELYEFKIFNRWGQVIFDSEGDINATWDGRFKGIDQEVGVYIIYVKALGVYDEKFEFKKNLTLIR